MSAEFENGTKRPRPWPSVLFGAIIATVMGGVVYAIFAFWWFDHVKGDCGVIRFYEYLFGVIIGGFWLAGTVVGTGLAVYSFIKKSKLIIPAAVIAIIANLGVIFVCGKMFYDVRSGDFSLKDTGKLLQFLDGTDLDKRKLAAHALGERGSVEALPILCAILDNKSEDVNLRHNAATALGKICTLPQKPGVDLGRAISSLTGALKDDAPYLPCSVAKALGNIGDKRAIPPLAEFLNDPSRPVYAREEAARALGMIGGDEARTALEKARASVKDGDLAATIGRVLGGMN